MEHLKESLVDAVRTQDQESLVRILFGMTDEMRYDLLGSFGDFESPIFHCSSHESISLVKKLVDFGFLIDERDKDQCTLLMHAAFAHNTILVEWLLASFDIADKKDKMGWTAFHYACAASSIKCAELLLDVLGQDAIASPTDSGLLPIHIAAADNHLAMVKWLVNHGASVNSIDSYGATPLMHAAMGGCQETALYLVESCRADQTIVSLDGRTAKDLALRYHEESIAAMLD